MYSILLSLLLAIQFTAAIPVPLEAQFMSEPNQYAGYKAKFDEAKVEANRQIGNMQEVLKNPTDPRITQAFGPLATQDRKMHTIKQTVDKLATGTLKVHTSDPNVADDENHGIPINGYVPINVVGGDVQADPARFGSTFYTGDRADDKKFRAGTIIHEATHQLAFTGDHVGENDKRIIRGGRPLPEKIIENGGYAKDPIPNSDLAMGPRYTDLRANSPNMEYNADSYRVFAALCSRSLLKRALKQEDPVGYYLAKRQQCKPQPDYFKKKAEAKAAATKTSTAPPASSKQRETGTGTGNRRWSYE
ncbi:hypothetical protein M408DRAFT_211465 [Serendipita vermifera MAFF 305830]|uniref:Lysine-specific metallo-endopeptidase domain-containing protein n=1 Tax=Serendipita vermifera MAFF 305830 TaxID=933852 RepID=A0A0C3ALL6_SERVB|nr:hypothetical protein M408DRAFT_211465 [Serendipita vermifera MAFF 305830]